MKKTKAQKRQAKESQHRLRANLSLMVPVETSIHWAIRGTKPDPNQVMPMVTF